MLVEQRHSVEVIASVRSALGEKEMKKAGHDPRRLATVLSDAIKNREITADELSQRKKEISSAFALVAPHFLPSGEDKKVMLQAFLAALRGEITAENARLSVKQLRAFEGKLK